MTCSHSFFRNAGVKSSPASAAASAHRARSTRSSAMTGVPRACLDDAVGQPVHVEHLDPAAHVVVPDQQVKLGGQGVGQVAVEGGHQSPTATVVGCAGSARAARKAARCSTVTVLPVPGPPVTWAGPE